MLTNFRTHAAAFTADLVKTYRQILVAPEDRKYQHILWRFEPSDEVKEYELCTVTYGESSAPFSALRTIIQLVQDEGAPYPAASKALLKDIYVDDIATIQWRKRRLQSKLLGKDFFKLRKWASTHQELFQPLEQSDCQVNAITLSTDD